MFPERTLLVKMEDILLETEMTAKILSGELNIPYHENMQNFPARMKNAFKRKRYGDKNDKSQVGLWKNWKTIYGGFFAKNNYDMNKHFNQVKDMIEYFEYE